MGFGFINRLEPWANKKPTSLSAGGFRKSGTGYIIQILHPNRGSGVRCSDSSGAANPSDTHPGDA
jgi:hypothetical protein